MSQSLFAHIAYSSGQVHGCKTVPARQSCMLRTSLQPRVCPSSFCARLLCQSLFVPEARSHPKPPSLLPHLAQAEAGLHAPHACTLTCWYWLRRELPTILCCRSRVLHHKCASVESRKMVHRCFTMQAHRPHPHRECVLCAVASAVSVWSGPRAVGRERAASLWLPSKLCSLHCPPAAA